MKKKYTICLAAFGEILPELCRIIHADYVEGDFEKFENLFADSGKNESSFIVKGKIEIELSIKLEIYEGYFFADLRGSGEDFYKAKDYLWKCYINFGGNPDEQERP